MQHIKQQSVLIFVRYLLVLGFFVLSGCATNSIYKSQTALSIPLSSKVLVFPSDIIFSESKTLSSPEPSLEKTNQLSDHFTNTLMEFMFEKGIEYIPYESNKIIDEHISIVQQAEVVVDATQSKRTSGNRFYSLSQDSLDLLSSYNAQYVLISDYSLVQPSSGAVLVSLLVGYVDRDTYESYSMSLFDLRDGQLVWSNYQPLISIGMNSGLMSSKAEYRGKVFTKIMTDFPL